MTQGARAPWVWAGAAAALGLTALDVARQAQLGVADTGLAFFAVSTCVAVAAAGAVARWPDRSRMALLIISWALVRLGGDFAVEWPTSRLATTLWMLATGLEPAVYAWMVLAYPSGRLRDRRERALVSVGFPLGLAWMGFPLLFADLRGCADCAPRVSSLLYTGHTFDYTLAGQVFWSAYIVLGICFVALLVRRLVQAPPGARRTLLPLAVGVVFAVAEFIALRVVWLGGWQSPYGLIDWVDRLNALVLPLAIVAGIVWIRRRRGPIGDLVVQLSSAAPGEVRTVLARMVGDPTLELALWIPEQRRFVDETGAPVEVEPLAAGRALTVVGPAGDPLAALVHDERLLGQRPLLEAAGSAGRLALENARLQAALRAQLGELRASRERLVTAADAERRRLERDLHDGAQQRLLAVGLALQLLRDRDGDPELLAQAEAELQTAMRELRDLARGIHPAILSEHGLGPAVRSLTDRVPLPVSSRLCDERFGESVEATAYFVVAESLTNLVRHAQARRATVSIERRDGCVVVEVADDGRGGAATRPGGGLQGLTDRVGAVGGTLTLTSERGRGTCIVAEIPCASS
ncbi:MAG TPA: sensor histidine kinase [Gaiellaceae bacterium]|nr:sensor histidine kinase [Gaiellaceae bacterium]